MRTISICAVVSSILISGCSTVANGSNQRVEVNTGDVIAADCLVTGGSDFAVEERFVTPAEIRLPRSKKTIKFSCEKEGYETGTKNVVGRIEGSTAGNILVGGPIGVGVDALSGAIYKYPDVITVPMKKLGEMANASSDDVAARDEDKEANSG